MSGGMHIAQFNWGILRHDWDDPRVAGFTDNLERVNAIAQHSPGFVWRMTDTEMEAEQLDTEGPLGGHPRLASTLSVWDSAAALETFVHKTVHGQFVARREEWFDPVTAPRYVLWQVPEGHRPGMAEAKARMDLLMAEGASEQAFDFNWLRHNGAVAAE